MEKSDIYLNDIADDNFKIIKLISNSSLYGVIFKVSINGIIATLKVDFRLKSDLIGNKEVNNEAHILEYISLYDPSLTTEFYDFQMLNNYGIRILYEKMNNILNWDGGNKPDYETAVEKCNVYILLMEYLGPSWIELNVITNETLQQIKDIKNYKFDRLKRDNSVNARKIKIIYESVRKNINKLHKLKFVHCDLHSGNIMVNTNNIRENKIIDFGRSFNSGDDMWNKELSGKNPYTEIECNKSVVKYINDLCGEDGQIPCTDE